MRGALYTAQYQGEVLTYNIFFLEDQVFIKHDFGWINMPLSHLATASGFDPEEDQLLDFVREIYAMKAFW
jgi:hypothetical protein